MKWISIALIFVSSVSLAQSRPRYSGSTGNDDSRVTYDISGSSGSYNGASYNEVTLGLNWIFKDWLTWRNSAFTRQSATATESYQGLDSSLRLSTSLGDPQDVLGLSAFIGPGVRFASKSNSAAFAEAGVTVRLGGLRIGLGAKALNYFSTRSDESTGTSLPKADTQYFVTISGGGTL